MDRIASFAVDHNKLLPGLYLSRQDGDVVTLDLRFKKPNTGDLLSNSEMHSVEHLIATLLRHDGDLDVRAVPESELDDRLVAEDALPAGASGGPVPAMDTTTPLAMFSPGTFE